MSRVLVKLRVSRETFEEIRDRILAAGQADRIFSPTLLSVDEIALELEPDPKPKEKVRGPL